MRVSSAILCVFTAFTGGSAQTQVATGTAPIGAACSKLNENALTQVAQGQSAQAEKMLAAALATFDRFDHVCAGLTMHNMAALLAIPGRLSEAEAMAQRAVNTLQDSFPPDDPALLRPLQILAAVQFELGKIARARESFKRMQSIRPTRPEDRALVCAMAASLLEAEGKWREGESQYHTAIQALKDCGRGDTTDAGALLNGLGNLYMRQHRMGEARRALDEALAILEHAPDASPWDRIKVLYTRGLLGVRQGKWIQAEQDLANALSIADHQARVEPTILRYLLINYAAVLQKNHRRREARSIARRAAALDSAPEDGNVVNVADLLARKKTRK